MPGPGLMAVMLLLGLALGLILAERYLADRCPRCNNATRVVFYNAAEEETMDVLLSVGETATFRAALLRDDDSRDESYEDARYTQDAGTEEFLGLALDPVDPLVVTLTGLKATPLDENSQPGAIPVTLTADSDAGAGQQIIGGTLTVRVREDNATRVVFEQIANPQPAPAEPKPAEPLPEPEPIVPPADPGGADPVTPPPAEPVFPDPASITPDPAPEPTPEPAAAEEPASEPAPSRRGRNR